MKPRILFIGGTPRGLALMKMLMERKEKIVRAFILKEDEHEPYQVSTFIEQICRQNNIPVSVCKRIEDSEIPEVLALKPDVGFVCGWRTLISDKLYKHVPYGCLTAHDSLLPKYRGFAPTSWAIINGEKETGVTLFKIDDGIYDSGEIFGQKAVPIGPVDTASDIYPKIIQSSVELYREFLEAAKSGQVKFQKQDESKATYAKRRRPEDGEIIWTQSAQNIFNLIRALTPPYPPARTWLKDERIFVHRASMPERSWAAGSSEPGKVVSVSEDGVLVNSGTGQIRIHDLTKENGEKLDLQKYFSSATAVLGKQNSSTIK